MATSDIRLSILTFPQEFTLAGASANISLNVLLIPRYDPLSSLVPAVAGTPAFSGANIRLNAMLVQGNDTLPELSSGTAKLLNPAAPANQTAIFTAIKNKFNIDDSLPRLSGSGGYASGTYIKKYLTQSYRGAFNFTQPKTPFAVTDDSYICAIKNAIPSTPYNPEVKINWGKVFAFILRQPLLAQELGMVYRQVSVDLPSEDFYKEGGWLYVDFAAGSDFQDIPNNDQYIQRYAARIPALSADRSLFAAVQFPVNKTGAPPTGNFDEVFADAAAYDDGFARIVHGSQPPGQQPLGETADGSIPTKDIGIRLGWDDEQILIWHNRQIQAADPSNTTAPQAPMGVFSYRVDVGRFSEVKPADRNNINEKTIPWHTLVKVHSDDLSTQGIDLGPFDGELGVEVYPMQYARQEQGEFWLPAFFTTWHGNSLVVTDKDAYELNSHDKVVDKNGNPAGVALNTLYKPVLDEHLDLKYGETYYFRVRLADITGGGPSADDYPAYESDNPFATVPFRRYVPPQKININNLPDPFTVPNSLANPYTQTSFAIQRPLLNYPALLFTGLDTQQALDFLKQDKANIENLQQNGTPEQKRAAKRPFGYYDPDVDFVGITIEIKALEMDNLLSKSGNESYILLYEAKRKFPEALDDVLDLQLNYQDMPVIHWDDPNWIAANFQPRLEDGPLVLPTGRTIRLTMNAVCRKDAAFTYFAGDTARIGGITQFMVRNEPSAEPSVFLPEPSADQLKSIYLQPDPYPSVNLLAQLSVAGTPDAVAANMMQRLAAAVSLDVKGMTLIGKQGDRIQFGCSQFIRHTLSPDNSSITFSTKADLVNHWIHVIILNIGRDWTWDELQPNSFAITRQQKFGKDANYGSETDLGVLTLNKTISRLALQNPDRKQTTIVFFDAVEPKPLPGHFPDIIDLKYFIKPAFKTAALATPQNSSYELDTRLPVTTIPAQVPGIASAGIAFSDYVERNNYSQTDTRQKYLWFEFEEPVADPDDNYFVRMLTYAPDPLLADFIPDLAQSQDEPPLPVDPELIRVISRGQPQDDSGLDAMQPLIPADPVGGGKPVHFIVPLPPGLFPDSKEMFGFFVYEVRTGHTDKIWSTAQGRFGHPLRISGVQHPAPQLFCNVVRDSNRIFMNARYAESVFEGKNLTPNPPRTDIWGLLYTQVLQADGKTYRNILISEKKMDKPSLETGGFIPADFNAHIAHDIPVANRGIMNKVTPGVAPVKSPAELVQPLPTGSLQLQSPDMPQYGQTWWELKEITPILFYFGLPANAPLSVLAVEMMPSYSNQEFELYSNDGGFGTSFLGGLAAKALSKTAAKTAFTPKMANIADAVQLPPPPDNFENPLSADLGKMRILRTSPLTPVPDICAG